MKQIPILMPQMGQSVAEGTIIRWLKAVGEPVQADENLLEVETDKATVAVESPATGRLAACLKREGEIAAAGEVIGFIEAEVADEALAQVPSVPPGTGTMPEIPPARATLPEIDREFFSPYVLRLAMQNNISLAELRSIRGTGVNGRITRTDILRYLSRRPIAGAGEPSATGRDLAELGEVIPMSSLRKTIADHMVQSIRTSAHVTMVHAVDMTHVVELRTRFKEKFAERYRAKLSYTSVLLFVTSRILRQFPKINASVYGTNIVLRREINIGCAVALADETLVVPVVHHADQMSFPEIAQTLGRLIAAARAKALTRADVEGGTFTISNFGAFGSLIGTPIIHQPQVAILGMGAVFKAPVVVDDRIAIRDQLYLSFSFDHRIIDGDLGGRFLHAIEKAIGELTAEKLSLTELESGCSS